jgi:acyl-CoA synthetase (NDP forming)
MGVEALLRPKSVAIVGASDKVGPGFNAWNALQHVGYGGEIHLVNPNKPELFGRTTYKSLDDIPGEIDAAFVSVQAGSVLEVARQAIGKKAGGLAILSSGFGEAGEAGARAQRDLIALAEAHGLAVCGPNCLGLLNFSGSSALFGTSLPDQVERGRVAAIVQSGSIGIALLNAARGLGLSYLITSGNEAVTTAADYLECILDEDEVGTVILFAEQIKKPQKFIAMVGRARELGKPVIVLKSGRSEKSQAAVMAHTGAVAGSVEACDAALRAAGAIQVLSLDELIETAVLVSTVPSPPRRRGVGVLSLSGGEIALALDAADEARVELPSAKPVEACLARLLPEFANIANPLDLTWAGLYDPEVARGCARALGSHPDVGALVLLQDAPKGLGPQQAGRYARLLASVAAGARDIGLPLVAVSNLSGEIHPDLAAAAQTAGVPYLRGTGEGFSALGRYARWAAGPPRPAARPHDGAAKALARARLDAIGNARMPAEHEGREILAAYGLDGPRERLAASLDEAVAAAESIGFPVVLKCLVAGLIHKTEAGLVQVGLRSADELTAAAQCMLARAEAVGGPVLGLLVQEQVKAVAELLVGARIDPDFGPLVVVGAGGILVELYRDVAVRLAPIDEDEALEALRSTRAADLLDGFRGKPRGDTTAAARAVSAVSRFAAEFADTILEVEVNPLAILPEGEGSKALDCALLLRPASSSFWRASGASGSN